MPVTPNPPSVGPTARTIMRLPAPVPPSTNPVMGEPATPPTGVRTARLTMRAAVVAGGFTGSVEMGFTVSVAAVLVADPAELVTVTA